MNEPVSAAVGDTALPQAKLIIRSHFRLPRKPQSTLEALRVFFPREANGILSHLHAGPVEVRRGDLRTIRALSLALTAQGFDVDVDVIAHDDDERIAAPPAAQAAGAI